MTVAFVVPDLCIFFFCSGIQFCRYFKLIFLFVKEKMKHRRGWNTHCWGRWSVLEHRHHRRAESATSWRRILSNSRYSICTLGGIQSRWLDLERGRRTARLNQSAGWSASGSWSDFYSDCYCYRYRRQCEAIKRMSMLGFRALCRRPPAACLVRNSPPVTTQFNQ